MVYKPNVEATRQGKEILQGKKWSVGLVTAAVGLGMFVSEIQRIKDHIADPLNIGYLTIFAITGVLIFLWIWATAKELDLCFEWLDPVRYVPPSSFKETVMMIGLGLILSLLLFAARDPLFFGIVFTVYSAIVTYTNYYTKTEIHDAILASRKRIEGEVEAGGDRAALATLYRGGVDVLERYFNTRPQTTRHVVILFFCAIGLVASVVWKASDRALIGMFAYGVFVAIIVVSEIVIAAWRLARDGDLRPIRAELNELTRAEHQLSQSS